MRVGLAAIRHLCLVGVAFCVIATFPAHADESLPLLFGVPAGNVAAKALSKPSGARAALRAKAVNVATAYLDPRSARTAQALVVELFGDYAIVERTRVDERGPGNYTWHGKVRGLEHGNAVLTVIDGRIAGSIVIADEGIRTFGLYQVLSVDGGVEVLRQLDPAAFPPDHARAPLVHARLDAPIAGHAKANGDGVMTIDVMVLYSNQAAQAAGTFIDTQIQHAVDRTNLAYVNSGIAAHLRLVHYARANYDEGGDFTVDLDRLINRSDGIMDDAHALRDRYGADVVSLFVENADACGYSRINADAESAFTVVSRGCAGDNLSLAHEIGHLFGARHDAETDASSSPHPYGHGYVYPAGNWRTVMAYNTIAPNSVRVPYFSNPGITFGAPPVPMGNAATADVARVHNERVQAVANFREATAAAAPSDCEIAALPSYLPPAGGVVAIAGECADGGTPTTWTWTRNGISTGGAGDAILDALPANAALEPTYYRYVAMACNAGSCAPSVAVVVTVTALPIVTANFASAITAGSATLVAIVSSNGAGTTVTFRFGATTAYGSSVIAAPAPLAPALEEYPASAIVNGLRCNTTYHFSAIAESVAGTASGNDATFATAPCAPGNPGDIVTTIEFYHATLDHYFITWVAEEIATLDAGTAIKGWSRTGRAFNSRSSAQGDTSPVCRYYIPPELGNSHFFGRGTAECTATGHDNPRFVLEASAFMHMHLPNAGVCPPSTIPVYRVFSNRPDANHRYTTDRSVRADMVAKGWMAEGDGPDLVAMCAPQ